MLRDLLEYIPGHPGARTLTLLTSALSILRMKAAVMIENFVKGLEKQLALTLFLDASCGRTLVALNFEEAHLTSKVFKALKRNGHRLSYRRKLRYSLRRPGVRA